jgi:hypothetical protein
MSQTKKTMPSTKKLSIQIVSAAMLFLVLATIALADPGFGPQGVFLGHARVDGRYDHDLIRIDTQPGPFRAIQFRVDGGPVEFRRVVVRYKNGFREELPVPNRIAPGGRSRIIRLSGHPRSVRHVELWYGRPHWARGTTVAVYGYR